MNLLLAPMQDIMEKFEFFPIKCRIQRAAEIQQQFFDKEIGQGCGSCSIQSQKPFNMKVCLAFAHRIVPY